MHVYVHKCMEYEVNYPSVRCVCSDNFQAITVYTYIQNSKFDIGSIDQIWLAPVSTDIFVLQMKLDKI